MPTFVDRLKPGDYLRDRAGEVYRCLNISPREQQTHPYCLVNARSRYNIPGYWHRDLIEKCLVPVPEEEVMWLLLEAIHDA